MAEAARLGAGGVGRGGWVAGVDINMDMGGWSTTTALKIHCLLTVSGCVVAGTVQCWKSRRSWHTIFGVLRWENWLDGWENNGP